MVELSAIEAQLAKLGVKKTFFCKPEIRELQHILMDNEEILKFVNGRYHNGYAIMVATAHRLLLIDKKPLYLTVEDIRYDMISEVDVGSQLFNATITIFTVNKKMVFNSMRKQNLRDLTSYVQKRVMEVRQYGQEATPAMQAAQPVMPLPDDPQPSPTIAGSLAQQVASHVPHHMPHLASAAHHTRDYIPHHFSQAVGSTATKLASRIPNHYTRGSLVTRQRTPTFVDY